jgi:hypothetical protein
LLSAARCSTGVLLVSFFLDMSTLRSAPFRQQHQSMRKCIEAMRKHFNPLLLPANAKEVRLQLTQLFGELAQYLQATGKDLYPALAETPDPAARAEAARFSAEFKQMLPRLAEFNRRWSSAEAIRVQASAFLKEANELLTWLERRFAAESSGLLPLLDRLDAASAAPAKVQLARI